MIDTGEVKSVHVCACCGAVDVPLEPRSGTFSARPLMVCVDRHACVDRTLSARAAERNR